MPGFIQGLTKEQLMDNIKTNVPAAFKSISYDHSSYDSSQKKINMQLTDNKFLDIALDDITEIFRQNNFTEPEEQAKRMVRD